MYFKPVHQILQTYRISRDGSAEAYQDHIYADDLTVSITAPDLATLQERSWLNDNGVNAEAASSTLQIQKSKTHNIVLSPGTLPHGIYQRRPPVSLLGTKMRRKRQYALAAREDETWLEFDLEEQEALPAQHILDARGFPYPIAENMRVLGVQLAEWFSLDSYYQALFSRAQVRQGVLAKVAHSSWGLETSILRVTHGAIITSLLRYGLTLVAHASPTT